MNETRQLVETLKEHLRARRITYARVAIHLGLSEASVKRMFSTASFRLERFEKICELVGVRVSELARRAERRDDPLTRLTPDQEAELIADPKLILVAYLVLNNWRFEQILESFRFTEASLIARLARLDRLRMIELQPGNRVRRLVARNFSWRPGGPVQAFFAAQLADFIDADFGGDDERLRFAGALLAPASIGRLKKALDRVMRDFDDRAADDADLPLTEKRSVGVLLAIRPWEVPLFRDHRRETSAPTQ